MCLSPFLLLTLHVIDADRRLMVTILSHPPKINSPYTTGGFVLWETMAMVAAAPVWSQYW